MTRTRWFLALAFAGSAFGAANSALAQPPLAPRITHVMPIGGQAGSTFELHVSGSDMADAEGLHFSFPGAKVESLGAEAPPPPPKGKAPPKKGMTKTPSTQTTQRFKVTLPPGAPLGIHDVRVVTKKGVTNPRAFVVSDQKEFVEQEPNDDVPAAQKIELNSSVSGVISTPTDVDYYAIVAKRASGSFAPA